MNRPTAAEVLAAMKDHGTDVSPYRGWDRAGSSNTCAAVLIHHTSTSSASISNPAPSLGWAVTAYDKPCANALVGKVPGSTYLLAALNGAAYHCGQGGPWPWAGIPEGNRPDLLWGIEIDDPGVKVGTFTDYQIENTTRMVAALWEVFGWTDPRSIATHKCWTDGCHGGNTRPSPNLGRKNDTIDGAWREWPGSDTPAPYNAPWWRERVLERLSTGPALWDGTIPSRSAVMRVHPEKGDRPGDANLAAWRVKARLADLGYVDPGKVPASKRAPYPVAGLKAYREAQGWPGDGFSERVQARLFGKVKP